MATQHNNELEPLLSSSQTFRNRKVWYKTASPYWLVPVFMISIMTYELGMATRIQFYLRAVCYDYHSRRGQIPPDDYPDEWCNNADVQSVASQFLLILQLCSAIPAIFVIGPLGSLSDRKGRKLILLMPTMGVALSTLIILLVGNFLETLGIYPLLLGPLLEGMSGGLLLLATASFAYATDCTSPTQRNVIFGWLQGSIYAGFALGPMIGGWIVEITNNLLSVFYVMFVIFVVIFLFLLFILPESLTEENLLENLKLQENLNLNSNRSWFLNNPFFTLIFSIFEPLSIFLPSNSIINEDNKINTKYSLLLLTIINTIFSAAVMGVVSVLLLYITLVFKWSLVEQGYYLFMFGILRAFVLFVLFPTLVQFVKRQFLSKNLNVRRNDLNVRNDNDNEIIVEDDGNLRKEFIFEVWILRLSLLIDTLAYIEIGLTTSSSMFIGATLAASLGAAVVPTIKSLQTNLVVSSQIGQLLGALCVLESITRIISPIIFNTLYSILVKTSPNLIWYGISILLATALLFSFGVAPNKYN